MTELPPDQAFIDVDRRLRQEVDRLIRSGAGPDPFRGLYIEDAEVFQLVDSLGRDAENGNWLGTYANRLSGLAHHFGLSPSQLRILVAAMAPDLDLRYERVFAYVQDDVQRKRPTIDLLLHLFWSEPTDRLKATWLFHAAAGLRRHRLIQLRADPVEDASLLASTVRTDPRVVAYVLGSDAIDEALIGVAAVCPIADEQQVPVSEPISSRLASLADSVGAARPLAVVVFEGPPGAGKLAAARYLAARRGQRLLTIEVEKLLRGNLDPQTAAQLAFREAAFQSAIIYFRGAGGLWEEGERPAALCDAIMGQHRVAGGLIAMSGPIGLGVPAVIGGIAVSRIQLDMPSNVERLAHWSAAVGGVIESEEALSEIAGAFRLTRGQIDDAIQVARQEAIAGGNSPDRLTREELYVGCRAVSGRGLTAVADEITRHASWRDLVLPADALTQLQELCATVRGRATVLDRWGFAEMTIGGTGTTALFAGPSGTGKTMAAGIIASELGLPLFRIDLARVVSKWIGETEKNLDRVFKAAEDSNAVLFLDEADSLLGKRSEVKDSHDRYANLEISYLLQKMELYDGLAILATNMRQLIDEAFMRRLSFTVLFPLPEEPDRRLIWDALWPAALPRQGDVDLDRLAHFRLPGGNIRNVVLAAAYLAATEGTAVGMRHLLHGVRREYQKLGKQLSDAELGEVPGPIELRVAVRR